MHSPSIEVASLLAAVGFVLSLVLIFMRIGDTATIGSLKADIVSIRADTIHDDAFRYSEWFWSLPYAIAGFIDQDPSVIHPVMSATYLAFSLPNHGSHEIKTDTPFEVFAIKPPWGYAAFLAGENRGREEELWNPRWLVYYVNPPENMNVVGTKSVRYVPLVGSYEISDWTHERLNQETIEMLMDGMAAVAGEAS